MEPTYPHSENTTPLESLSVEATPSTEQNTTDEAIRRDLGMIGLTSGDTTAHNELRTLPPVEAIPSLRELGVTGPDSIHIHKYDQTNTVWRQLSLAEDTAKSERTYQQVELIADVERLQAYAPYISGYMDVFNPDELHALVGKLDLLRAKNRPDFNAIEAKIIDVVIRFKDDIRGDIVGIARRAEQNTSGRRGMQWATLNKLAAEANSALLIGMYTGDERTKYIVPIERDPDYDPRDKKSINLKAVYQFVSLSHGYDIHGQRSTNAHEKRLNTFVKNFDIITQWYEQVKPTIDQLPRDRAFADSLNDKHTQQRRPARSGIQFKIAQLMEAMGKRYEGDEKFGKYKSYQYDPAGAINLQLLIAHTTEAIRKKLDANIHPVEEEIVPLEDFDF